MCVAALIWAALSQAGTVPPKEIECRPFCSPSAVTTQKASFSAGISAAPSLIRARTGVRPVVPMISAEVINAPSQCDTSMIFWPATPGKKYLLPPDIPTTSCGSTGPTTRAMSWSTTARLSRTSTPSCIRPSESSAIRSPEMLPRWAKASGRHHS